MATASKVNFFFDTSNLGKVACYPANEETIRRAMTISTLIHAI